MTGVPERSCDDAIERNRLTPENFPKVHSALVIISNIGNESISPAKTDAAIKIKGFF